MSIGPEPTPWAVIANRGEFTMTILSRARATLDGVPMRPGVQWVGVLSPDDGLPITHLGFVSVDDVRLFVAEMDPREVWFVPAQDESVDMLNALVQRDPGAALH